jgi:hypothetical protein
VSTVWLVIKVGVYDQGVHFVASSRQGAESFTRDFQPDRDGYHGWDIREMAVDCVPFEVRDEPMRFGLDVNVPIRSPEGSRRAREKA